MHYKFPTLSPLDVIHALASDDAPILLDVRLEDDVAINPGFIPSAVPVSFDDVKAHINLAHDQGAILICHRGLKLSAGATARLMSRGLQAWRIAGGHKAWLAEGFPVVVKQAPNAIALALDATPAEVAAAWATSRFVAPRAELLKVLRADLDGVARHFAAACPTATDAPPLPELAAFLKDVSQPDSLFSAQLCGAGEDLDLAFKCLDVAYRGQLRHIELARGERRRARGFGGKDDTK